MKKYLAALVAVFTVAIAVVLLPAGAASAYIDPNDPLLAAFNSTVTNLLATGASVVDILKALLALLGG